MRAIISYVDLLAKQTAKPVKWLSFPRTSNCLREAGIELPSSFETIPPMGYLEFLTAQRKSHCVVSDSGTAQEEPAVLGVPVCVPRDFTERWESVQAGNSLMIDLSKPAGELVLESTRFVREFSDDPDIRWMGEGDTAQRVVSILRDSL